MAEEPGVKEIQPGQKRGWEIELKSPHGSTTSVEPATITSKNKRMGVTVTYGMGKEPESFDRWIIREPRGGGSVIVPYVIVDGEVYVGAVQQFRSLTGSYQTEVPRGFSKANENSEDTAKRELQQETGLQDKLLKRVYKFSGKPMNPSSTFFQANPHRKEGVVFYGLRLKEDEVQPRRESEDPTRKVFILNPELRGELKEVNEKIKPEGLRFLHVDLLQNSSDAFTLAAIGKLRTDVKKQIRDGALEAKLTA